MKKPLAALLCAFALASCDSGSGEHDPIPEPSSSKDLVIEQRSLPADTTLTALGLRPGENEKADERWAYQCDYSKPISLEEVWKQRFRVTIQNVSTEVLEFDVNITQYGAEEEDPPRERSLGRLVIPPLTEKRFSGFMLNPRKPGEKTCEVELFEPEDSE